MTTPIHPTEKEHEDANRRALNAALEALRGFDFFSDEIAGERPDVILDALAAINDEHKKSWVAWLSDHPDEPRHVNWFGDEMPIIATAFWHAITSDDFDDTSSVNPLSRGGSAILDFAVIVAGLEALSEARALLRDVSDAASFAARDVADAIRLRRK